MMELVHEDNSDGVRIIRLKGRMDIEGNNSIALRFNALALGGGPMVVVDLSGLEFLSSIGIATLVQSAKAARLRKGILALFGARPHVLTSLERTNIPSIIPTCSTLDEALARVSASEA